MIQINPSWTFREAVEHLKTLRDEYNNSLASFSMFQYKEKANYIHSTRDQFYSLNLFEWQIDRMWNYMNGFDSLCKIKLCSLRYK